jgi:hypothetical protein
MYCGGGGAKIGLECCTGKKAYMKRFKLSRYSPGQTLRLMEAEAQRISRHRYMKVVSLSALRTGRIYPSEYISVRSLVELRAIVRPEGLSKRKIPMTPSGIQHATFRLVVHNNHLQYDNFKMELKIGRFALKLSDTSQGTFGAALKSATKLRLLYNAGNFFNV